MNTGLKVTRALSILLCAACVLTTTGCGSSYQQSAQKETYQSPQVEGQAARINLEQVEDAFFTTKGKGDDFAGWMGALEKRVNEIYEGPEVVSLDASRETGKLVVTGYVENKKQPGYQPGEDKLFAIEQTGDAVNNQLPYRVSNGDGHVYHEGHRSIFDNPIVQMMMIGSMMNMWGGRYYTPMPSIMSLGTHRDTYRQGSGFMAQKTANQGFQQKFKEQRVASRRSFGGVSSAPTSGRSRSWSTTTTTKPSTGGWGGLRRSGGGMRWGGRRR